jgi:alpha-1,2-mannosyltransferase
MRFAETPRVRWAVALALLAAAWCSAGTRPLMEAVREAHRPADFTRDFVGAHALVHGGPAALAALEGDAANDYAQALGAPRLALYTGPYYGHPPAAMLLVVPLVPLGYRSAALVWLLASLAALAWLAWLLAETLGASKRLGWWPRVGLFLLLLVWPPVLHNLAKGQWSMFLAALLAAGWRALEGGRHRQAGAWIGTAASLKLTPLLLLGYLGLRYRRAAVAMAATMAVLTIAGMSTGDTGLHFAANVQRNTDTWQTWTANTASLNGFVARLFAGGPWARPLWHAPLLARALTLALGVSLVLCALRLTRRSDTHDGLLYGAWCALTILLNPLAWSHTLVIALVPLAELIRRRVRPGAVLAIAVILTIPRHTLARVAALDPGAPAMAPIVSLHALAVLALFVLAMRAAAQERAVGAWPRELSVTPGIAAPTSSSSTTAHAGASPTTIND